LVTGLKEDPSLNPQDDHPAAPAVHLFLIEKALEREKRWANLLSRHILDHNAEHQIVYLYGQQERKELVSGRSCYSAQTDREFNRRALMLDQALLADFAIASPQYEDRFGYQNVTVQTFRTHLHRFQRLSTFYRLRSRMNTVYQFPWIASSLLSLTVPGNSIGPLFVHRPWHPKLHFRVAPCWWKVRRLSLFGPHTHPYFRMALWRFRRARYVSRRRRRRRLGRFRPRKSARFRRRRRPAHWKKHWIRPEPRGPKIRFATLAAKVKTRWSNPMPFLYAKFLPRGWLPASPLCLPLPRSFSHSLRSISVIPSLRRQRRWLRILPKLGKRLARLGLLFLQRFWSLASSGLGLRRRRHFMDRVFGHWAIRWLMIRALSRLGSQAKLGLLHSPVVDWENWCETSILGPFLEKLGGYDLEELAPITEDVEEEKKNQTDDDTEPKINEELENDHLVLALQLLRIQSGRRFHARGGLRFARSGLPMAAPGLLLTSRSLALASMAPTFSMRFSRLERRFLAAVVKAKYYRPRQRSLRRHLATLLRFPLNANHDFTSVELRSFRSGYGPGPSKLRPFRSRVSTLLGRKLARFRRRHLFRMRLITNLSDQRRRISRNRIPSVKRLKKIFRRRAKVLASRLRARKLLLRRRRSRTMSRRKITSS